MARIALTLFGFLSLWAIAAADESSNPPTEVRMKSGYVMKRVEIVRYEGDRVVLKHAAGVDSIGLAYLVEPDRQKLIEYRKIFEGAKSAPVGGQGRRISGQVFVTTVGAGSYKFSGAMVFAFHANLKDTILANFNAELPIDINRRPQKAQEEAANETWKSVLAKFSSDALGIASTDAEGKFQIATKGNDPAILVCITSRLAGRSWEYNTWIVDAGQSTTQINLHNLNLWAFPQP